MNGHLLQDRQPDMAAGSTRRRRAQEGAQRAGGGHARWRRRSIGVIGVVVIVLATACNAVGTWRIVTPDRTPTEPKTFSASSVACVASTCVVIGGQSGSGERNVALVGPPGALQPSVTGFLGDLTDVACSTATDCVAVGTAEDGFGPRAVRWDGTTWHRLTDPLTELRDVDCVTGGPCFAAGSVWGPTALQTVVVRLDGNTWTDVSPTITGIEPTGISCASATWCVLVGANDTGGTSLVYDGTTWTPRAIPQAPTEAPIVDAVSCPAVGWCVATAGSFGETYRQHAVGLVLSAGAWSQVATPVGTTFLYDVDCVSTTSCTAVGWDAATTSSPTVLRALRFDGAAFTPVTLAGTAGVETLHGVSCAATTCTAVGSTPTAGAPFGSVVVLSGTSTLARQTVPTVTVPPGLQAVSCSSPSSCVAVGERSQRYDGISWTALGAGDPSSAAGVELRDVDCASASFCMAVGTSDPSASAPVALRWNGTAFVATTLPALPTFPLQSVDCASSSFCLATATTFGGTEVIRWDGTGWTILPSPPVYQAGAGAVSCPAVGTCVVTGTAVDRTPTLATWVNGTWTSTALPLVPGADGGRGHAVSCSGPDDCVVVGELTRPLDVPGAYWTDAGWATRDGVWTVTPLIERGPDGMRLSCSGGRCVVVNLTVFDVDHVVPDVVVWDGTGWSGTDPLPPTDDTVLRDISCIGRTWCLAVGQPDTAVFESPPA